MYEVTFIKRIKNFVYVWLKQKINWLLLADVKVRAVLLQLLKKIKNLKKK